MSYLRIYAGDTLLEQRELSSEKTTIGRIEDNDIVLPSNGVSKRHAIIQKDGPSFVVRDNGSANGVYVNGERIQHRTLKYWDEIQIFDYVIKFMASAKLKGDEAGVSERPAEGFQPEVTMEVDISSLGDLAQLRKKVNIASVTLAGSRAPQRKQALERVNFKIGKAPECDVHISGWLAPRLAANIQRRDDGFYLIPGRRGKVTVNGAGVSNPVKLNDDDDLTVRGMALKFYFRPADD